MFTTRDLLTDEELRSARELLESAGLEMPEARDYGVGFYDSGKLAAVGFRRGTVILGVCVALEYRGGELAAKLMTHLLTQATAEGMQHIFLFTKPDKVESFERLGFKTVATAPDHAGLLEFGWPNFDSWMAGLKKSITPLPEGSTIGAIVMNANPYTLGHHYLVETASAKCDRLYVFVVQEDASVFPYNIRFELVTKGAAPISNCMVLPGGPYMVTRSTFPSYFTGRDKSAEAHAALDATVFATRIAPELGIARRFVGTEPHSPVTLLYNNALQSILPTHGIDLEIIERKTAHSAPISASRVRALLARGDAQATRDLVPPSTFSWLTCNAAKPVLASLANSHTTPEGA